MKRQKMTKRLYFAFMMVVIAVLAMTPLGFFQLGPIKITLIHIPVILGSLLFGWRFGAGLGLVFGCVSIIVNTLTPGLLSFAFSPFIPVLGTTQGSWWAPLIAIVPRVLVGILPAIVFRKVKSIELAVVVGSLTNTILVLGLIMLVFNTAYATAMGVQSQALVGVVGGIVLTNGLAEALLAVMLVSVLYRSLKRHVRNV